MACSNCRSKELEATEAGHVVCRKCGTIQARDDLVHHFGGIDGTTGAFVSVGTAGSGTDYSYKERKIYHSNQVIEEIAGRLSLSDHRRSEVQKMINEVTDGEFGLGVWFTVLVGACCYIIMRKNNIPIPISEVCASADCELYELGSMISRVVQHLGLVLPEFDISGMLDRKIKEYSGFHDVDEDKLKSMVKQGTFIVQCCIKWYLTTGRRPVPVIAAVLIFVAELNGIKIKIEEVARDFNVALTTCKKRYKELLEALVEVAQRLPWGRDVNIKNIVKNAPYVMQYMELKSSGKTASKRNADDDGAGRIRFNMEGLVRECLSGEVNQGEIIAATNGSQCSGEKGAQDGCLTVVHTDDDMENNSISYKTLANMYAKFKTEFSNGNELEMPRGRWETQSPEYSCLLDDWWSGRSELCRKLVLDQIVEKDVGFDAHPPSYIRGLLNVKRRREKIQAAKIRINKIVSSSKELSCPDLLWFSNTDLVETNDIPDLSSSEGRRIKRKRRDDEIDWEDFIIESLLLHRVKEEEIEKGHYKALLDLYVFKSSII